MSHSLISMVEITILKSLNSGKKHTGDISMKFHKLQGKKYKFC